MIITIDGPAASGKSTVAKEVARSLGCYYLQTGLLYRALVYILKARYHTSFSMAHGEIKLSDAVLKEAVQSITYLYQKSSPSIIVQGDDITPHLSDATLDNPTSLLSTYSPVREALNALQRTIAQKHACVIEGRDSGSVVFPHADYKFFLTACLQTRVRRFLRDPKRAAVLDEAAAEKLLEERDTRDRQRKVAPLIIPQGAIIIDSSSLTQEETVQKILSSITKNESKA